MSAKTNDSGGTVLHWYRWPLDLPGELEATLRATCAENGLQLSISALSERVRPQPP
jgi:hypothetical protein